MQEVRERMAKPTDEIAVEFANILPRCHDESIHIWFAMVGAVVDVCEKKIPTFKKEEFLVLSGYNRALRENW